VAVFISYSHSDAKFAETLAANLFKTASTAVWIDRWELNVGDSLIQRIQEAIDKASALIVVLSKASVESEWCKKELTAGLMRELEEKKVLVLPALLEDCQIPLFLRDKKYADFRTDFDAGLRDIVSALAKVTNSNQSRVQEVKGHVDWSSDWSVLPDGHVNLEVTIVEQAEDLPFTTLSLVDIELNDLATKRHAELVKAGFEGFARQLAISTFAESGLCDDFLVYIPDAEPVRTPERHLTDPVGFELVVVAECRRMGTDTGKDLVLNVGRQLRGMADHALRALQRSPSEQRSLELLGILKKYRA
jgi:hypothetical protein